MAQNWGTLGAHLSLKNKYQSFNKERKHEASISSQQNSFKFVSGPTSTTLAEHILKFQKICDKTKFIKVYVSTSIGRLTIRTTVI